MSENTVTDAPAVWTPVDAVSTAIVADLNDKAQQYNALQSKVDAATGDNSGLIADLRQSSENEKVRSLMAKYDDLILKAEKILADADEQIKADLAASADMSEDDIKAAEETLKALRDDVKAGLSYLTRKYGEDVKSALTPLKGTKSSTKSGTGEGSAKPRLKEIYVNGTLVSATVDVYKTVKGERIATGETKVVSTFTLAAKQIPGATVETLTKAYLDAAKVSQWQDADNIVEFVVTDKDGNNVEVRACK